MSATESRLDLRPDHWAIVRDVLRRHVPDRRVVAFGSRATWTAKEYSDLDLAILGDECLPPDVVSALAEGFGESDLPFKVDIVDWTKIDEHLRDIVLRDGATVQIPRNHGRAPNSISRPLQTCRESLPFVGRLGDHADIVMGQSPPGDSCSTSGRGLPLLNGPTEFGAHHPEPIQFTTAPRKTALPGDLLFCVRGSTTGRMNWSNQEYAIGRGVAAIRHKRRGQLQPFVRAVIEFALPGLLARATGSTFPNVSAQQIADLTWPALEPSEQHAIAGILGTLDHKIELNRRMNETLEAMARAIFEDWFVDFGPVRAKMEGRAPYLPPELWKLFPDSLDGGGKPKGWAIRTLVDLVDINPARGLRKGHIAPYLNMANMPTKGHVPEVVVDRPFGSGMRFVNGDTLLARITPCLENGKTAYVDFLEDDEIGWGSTEYIVMRPKRLIPNEFAYCLARSSGFREFAIRSMTGTSGRQRVQAQALRQFPLVELTEEVAMAFGNVVGALISRGSACARESRVLASLRDTLLPKLISGEVRRRNAEKAIEAVT